MESKRISDGEILLLDKYRHGDELALRKLIERYERLVFSLVLYFSGCDRDRAFSITVSGFVRAIGASKSLQKDGDFLRSLIGEIFHECEGVAPVAKFDFSDFDDRPAHKKEALRIVKQALASLTPATKKLLLLRDQLHLAYEDIAAVAGFSEKEAKIQTLQARIQLMDKVKEIVERPEASA